MKGYTKYLYELGYNATTLHQHNEYLRIFVAWLEQGSLSAEDCGYDELVDFIDYLFPIVSSRKNPRSVINRILKTVSLYYDFKIQADPSMINPVRNLRLKDPDRTFFPDYLHEPELMDLYRNFETADARSIRNKVILSLLIFQGVTTAELQTLSVEDVKLRKGTVLIRGFKGSNFKAGTAIRELDLEARQILDMIEYINNIRICITAGKYRDLPGRNASIERINPSTNQLILSLSGSEVLKSTLLHLFRNVKEYNPRIKNATQIRQSVIAQWLRKYDIRRVQYMAGHRFVSSTEYYQQVNIESLKRKVIEFHPLK